MVPGGLLCRGSQQPLPLRSSTAPVGTAHTPKLLSLRTTNGPQTASQTAQAAFSTEKANGQQSHRRPLADFAIAIFVSQPLNLHRHQLSETLSAPSSHQP